MSWPCWLTYSGRFTHINGYPPAAGPVQNSESSPVRDRRSTTEPPNQLPVRAQLTSVVKQQVISQYYCVQLVFLLFQIPHELTLCKDLVSIRSFSTDMIIYTLLKKIKSTVLVTAVRELLKLKPLSDRITNDAELLYQQFSMNIGHRLIRLHGFYIAHRFLFESKQEGWLPPTKRASAAKINQYYRL